MRDQDQTEQTPRDVDDGAGKRVLDDRRTPVSPTDNPVPSSPQADEEAVRKGEETLERVKPY